MQNLRDRSKGILVESRPFAELSRKAHMARWTRDKLWQWGMGLALPIALGSACLDQRLIETVMGLWDDPPAARLTFFLSSTIVLIGLARNSARLRTLIESRPVPRPADHPSRQPAVLEPCND